jgi:chromate transporter
LQAALRGVIAASIALSLSMAFKTGRKELRTWPAWLLFGAAFLFSAIFRVPLLALLAVLILGRPS